MNDNLTIAEQYNNSKEMKAVQVQVYESFEDLRDSRKEWDHFVEDVCSDIFMTYDWCRIWWKYYGKNRNLRVFIFRSNDELVGIIPLFFEKIWLGPIFIKAVKIVGSDFALTQFSLPIRESCLEEVVGCFAEKLSCLDWDVIHIGQIAGNYGNILDFKRALDVSFNSFARVESRERGVQTYFDLADSWNAQLLSLSKRERGDIRRNYHYINKLIDNPDESVQTIIADEDNIQSVFAGFAEMHKKQWNRLNKAGHFGDWPGSYEFHLDMAKSQLACGRLRLFKVIVDSDCLGYEYDYKCGQIYFEILNARSCEDKYKNISLGKVVFSEQLKKAIEDNIISIDSMRGKFDHKIKMGGKLCPVHSIYVFRKSFLSQILFKLFCLMGKLYHICYYKIWFFRIAPKIFKKRGCLWRSWIRCRFLS